MKNFIINHFKISFAEFSYDFLIGLAITFILAALIRFFYQILLSENTYSDEQFSNSTFLVTICTYVIVYIVKESITLSLGLVGALSIIRFRTPIKDPFELSIFFVSIAIGIANAVFQYLPSILLTLLLLIYLLYLRYGFRWFSKNNFLINSRRNLLSFNVEIYSKEKFKIEQILKNFDEIKIIKITSLSTVDNQNSCNFQINLKNYDQLEMVKQNLDKIRNIDYNINEF